VVLQWSHYYRGDWERSLALKEDVLSMAERQFNLKWYVYAVCAASMGYYGLGRWHEALKEAEDGLKVAEEFSDNSLISFAAFIISIAHTGKGDLARAIEYGELAVEKAPTPADRAWAQTFLAWAWCRAGQARKGVDALIRFIPVYRAARNVIHETNSKVLLGEAYLLCGDYDKAKKTLEESLSVAKRCGMRFFMGRAQFLLGEVAIKTDTTLAASHFEKSIAVFQEIKAENELARAYAGYGRYYKGQGDVARACEYLTEALEIFDRLGTMIEPDKVRRELAELPQT
jgi:tetratricopeptide (TPR) repeat protein